MKKSTNRGGSRKNNGRDSKKSYQSTLLNWQALQWLPGYARRMYLHSVGGMFRWEPSGSERVTPKEERQLASRLIQTLVQFLNDNGGCIQITSLPTIKAAPQWEASKRAGLKRYKELAYPASDSTI